ncbi:MAG: AAA family ATPase [Clostridia bacterium]|nr:AAA family ATPase [Clostridia bacterium]
MKLIKVSILCRSYEALYQFNKAHGCSLWDSLAARIKSDCSDFVLEKKGSMQSVFYLATTEEASVWQDRIMAYMEEVNGTNEGCVFYSGIATADEIKQLGEKNPDGIASKPWFADVLNEAMAEKSAAGNREGVAPRGENLRGSEKAEETEGAEKPEKLADPQAHTYEKTTGGGEEQAEAAITLPKDLLEEVERINRIRSELLSVVRGQRHAVDEVVRALFECDAFASVNEKRKGPLATFLFAGPSGVGKTLLATALEDVLGRKCLKVDMSEYSDNLANGKFNGDYNNPAVVTGFVRQHPNGILIFDEVEKAHMNTIHLFLQILDDARLMDQKVHKEVSFRDTIIVMTTNAGHSLYDDTTNCNLSSVPKQVILEALRKDIDPTTREPYFPECLTTRFANGNVILFNHLEPYALLQIVSDELRHQLELFEKTCGIAVDCDLDRLASLVIYSSGGVSDARTLRGSARRMLVKELQESILQTHIKLGDDINKLKRIDIRMDFDGLEGEVASIVANKQTLHMLAFADDFVAKKIAVESEERLAVEAFSSPDEFKRAVRGLVDCVLIDPAAGAAPMKWLPNDVEDIVSDGMALFRYMLKYYPEVPIYILDTRARGVETFNTLLAHGGRGVVQYDIDDAAKVREQLRDIALAASVNNAAFALGRASKVLTYNCSQYNENDETAVISFDKLELAIAASSFDKNALANPDASSSVTFDDVIGCESAKKALKDFCKFIENPRELLSKGKRIPKGLLLYGPPGTGKTMLARAMATEAKAAFIPITATTFFGSFVGESERNIREIFARARRYAPSIIFVDEVDALARRRTGSITGRHNEDALNAFIAEMDGFNKDDKRPVFVIAATNYSISGEDGMVLDPAFVRRFDRRIFIDLPDEDARFTFIKRTLEKHAVDFGESHETILRNMARRSGGLSNADLDVIIELFMRKADEKQLTPAVLMDALDEFRFGELNKVDENSLRQTACHEAGHALVTRLLGKKVAFLTIASRGSFGGFMEYDHDETKGSYTFSELKDKVCCALAGRIAEITVFGKDAGMNTGAISDIKHARYYIKTALDEYAMGDKLYGRSRVAECEELIRLQYERTETLIAEHRDVLEKLTDLLVANKSLDQLQLEQFFAAELGSL